MLMLSFNLLAFSTKSSATAGGETCARTQEQCYGTGASAMPLTPCCAAEQGFQCLPVNQFYSKCAYQPKCGADDQQCAGKGDSVMKEVPCCTKGFSCTPVSDFYSKCVNASVPSPPPPTPPTPTPADEAFCCIGCGGAGCRAYYSPTRVAEACTKGAKLVPDGNGGTCVGGGKCAATTEQCGPTTDCCNWRAGDKCEAVNQYYSKCVSQPMCAAAGAQCYGTGGSVMEKTPCCDEGFVCKAINQYYSTCVSPNVDLADFAVFYAHNIGA